MARCMSCGTKTGFGGGSICQACFDRQQAEGNRQREEYLEEKTRETLAAIEARLEIAESADLFAYLNISSQAGMNEDIVGQPPDLGMLQAMTLNGWELVLAIPRTMGAGLTNRYDNGGSAWGAGIGGLVIGATLIMKLRVTREIFSSRRAEITTAIQSQHPASLYVGEGL